MASINFVLIENDLNKKIVYIIKSPITIGEIGF